MKKYTKFAAYVMALSMAAFGFASCGDDEDDDNASIEEQISFDGLNVVAQSTGKILVDGNVTANTKIKSLVLASDEDGKTVIVDLLKNGDQTKAKEINEAGEKEKTFTLSIPTSEVDVQTLYLVGKTKGDKKASSKISEELTYTIGAKNSSTGSYLSIIDNKQYKQAEAEANPAKVEVIAESSSDGSTVTGIKRATEAVSATISAGAGKSALFDANGKSVTGALTTGTIITASGAICKFSLGESNASGDATITGITIKSGLGAIKKVDVSAFSFSK